MEEEKDTLEQEETLSSDEQDIGNLSDEDFLKFMDETSPEVEMESEDEEDDEKDDETAEDAVDDGPDESDDLDASEGDKDLLEGEETDDIVGTEKKDETEDTKDTSDTAVDYKAEYERIKAEHDLVMAPFKANGKEISTANVEEVIALKQMGANYNKKMTAMKSGLKVLKTLENADIDEDKLNFLIDLNRKDPEAVKRIIKESGIDPLEIDTEEESNYSPRDHSATEEEVAFDQVVEDLKESEAFETTRVIVTKTWDDESRKRILREPDLLRRLNYEVDTGRYDKIQSIIDRERVFGRLEGVSDLAAYIDIVKDITSKDTTETATVEATKQKSKIDPSVAAKKKKAAVQGRRKNTVSKAKYTDDEMASMDDEEFLKLEGKNLY